MADNSLTPAGLPSIEGVNAAAAKRQTSVQKQQSALAAVTDKQRELTAARVESQKTDLQTLTTMAKAETEQRAQAATARNKLIDSTASDMDKLAAAEKMNPFVRSVRAIIGEDVRPSEISKRVNLGMSRINLQSRKESARQADSVQQMQSFLQQSAMRQNVAATEQDALNTTMRAITTNAQMTRDAFNAQTAAIDFGLRIRKAQREQREDTLSRMTPEQLTQLSEEAGASDTGSIDAGNGTMITKQDVDSELARQKKITQALDASDLANAAARADLQQTHQQQALDNLTLGELRGIKDAGYTVSGKNGPIRFNPAMVDESIAKRQVTNQSITDFELNHTMAASEALVSLDSFSKTADGSVQRAAMLFGDGSKVSRDVNMAVMKTSSALAAAAGTTPDNLDPAKFKTLTPDAVIMLGKKADKAQESVETEVESAAKTMFPDDEVGQSAAKAYVLGQNLNAASAMSTLIKESLGGTPVDAALDPADKAALTAIQQETAKYFQKDMQNVPDLSDPKAAAAFYSQQLFQKDARGRIRPDHEGLIQVASDAAYKAWVGQASTEVLISGFDDPRSPAFGKLNGNMVLSAIDAGEQYAESRKYDNVAQKGAAAAQETMRILRGVAIGNTNAADMFIEHLKSPVFADQIRAKANGTTFTSFLLSKGAVQGKFASNMLNQRNVYVQANAMGQQEALQRQAKLMQLFKDPKESRMFAYRMAGYLEGGASPEAVDAYIDKVTKMNGADPEKIHEYMQTAREAYAEDEKIRRGIVNKYGDAGRLLTLMADGFAHPTPKSTWDQLRGAAIEQGIQDQQLNNTFASVKPQDTGNK